MRKQNTVSGAIVVAIVVIAFIGGNVLAQGELTGSDEVGTTNSTSYSEDEDVPSDNPSAADEIAYSTKNVLPLAKIEYTTDESETLATIADPMSSGSRIGVALHDDPIELMPGIDSMLNLNVDSPSGHPYNTSMRFTGSTLKPRENNVDYTVNDGGGCVYITGGDQNTVWNLPLTLPQGAEVQYLRIYYYDQDPVNHTHGWFTKYDRYGQVVTEWGVDSMDEGNGYRDVLITPTETIDYSSYSYVINWRPNGTGSNLQLCGFRIYYYYPTYSFNFIPWISKQ
jgi:hypothetical protein